MTWVGAWITKHSALQGRRASVSGISCTMCGTGSPEPRRRRAQDFGLTIVLLNRPIGHFEEGWGNGRSAEACSKNLFANLGRLWVPRTSTGLLARDDVSPAPSDPRHGRRVSHPVAPTVGCDADGSRESRVIGEIEFVQPTGISLPIRSEERRVGKECRSRWSP